MSLNSNGYFNYGLFCSVPDIAHESVKQAVQCNPSISPSQLKDNGGNLVDKLKDCGRLVKCTDMWNQVCIRRGKVRTIHGCQVITGTDNN